MGAAFWAVSLLLLMMVFGILLVATNEKESARTDCELESKKVGNRTVKVWDCE